MKSATMSLNFFFYVWLFWTHLFGSAVNALPQRYGRQTLFMQLFCRCVFIYIRNHVSQLAASFCHYDNEMLDASCRHPLFPLSVWSLCPILPKTTANGNFKRSCCVLGFFYTFQLLKLQELNFEAIDINLQGTVRSMTT